MRGGLLNSNKNSNWLCCTLHFQRTCSDGWLDRSVGSIGEIKKEILFERICH